MSCIVAVATGSVTTPIGFIVLCIRVHIDAAIPVIAIHVCGVVEQSIISDRCEGTAGSRLLHTMADHADIMRAYIGDIAVVYIISRPVRRTAVAVGTIKCEGGRRAVAVEAS